MSFAVSPPDGLTRLPYAIFKALRELNERAEKATSMAEDVSAEASRLSREAYIDAAVLLAGIRQVT